MPSTPIVDFNKPPLTEVVCGITFEPLSDFLVPHFGLLWSEFKEGFPRSEEQPTLSAVQEGAPGESAPKPPQFEFTTKSEPRVWFISEDDACLLQVQKNMFLHNWRKTSAECEYPRYHRVKSRFDECFARFGRFISENGLGAITPIQQELTYVNIIPLEDEWGTLSHIGALFPDHVPAPLCGRFLPEPESISWDTAFPLPENAGRLRTSVKSAIMKEGGHPCIRMVLTARGLAKETSTDAMNEWFDMAHQHIVEGFVDLTGSRPQEEQWQKT
jgi:uncharacterized protein (TIGR04255 family)